ncbi:Mitochondrial-processing peptidase subunit alpha [Lobulomyces angularis]|nr:Mitochondrial-processing peptidase subunit alpha [Lobulomyces angularis]
MISIINKRISLNKIRRLYSSKSYRETKVTTLSNGLRIATQDSPGHFVSIGVFINAGTKYENKNTRGLTHILDRMAFKSTKDLPTSELVNQIETLGGNILAHSTRESIMYQAAVFRHDLEKMVTLFSSIVKNPLFKEEELVQVCEASEFELDELPFKPEVNLPEILHSVAFRSENEELNTYGNFLLCDSKERLKSITSDMLHEYRRTWFTPDRMVLAGVGMEHQLLVELAEKYFSDIPKGTPDIMRTQLQQTMPVKYSGGIKLIDANQLPPSPNPDDIPFTHIHIAFESMSMNDPDIYALATLASLMGGGGSFSAGGPGKGMYTRLYTDVLNRYHWVENCNMVNHSYYDTGLFGISASIPPIVEAHEAIVPILSDQLLLTTHRILPEELDRAKNQLKSNLLMSLESKMVELEDVGRQILVLGKRLDVEDMCLRIDSLTCEDLMRAARRVILGEDLKSTLNFGDESSRHWKRTGNGEPTVVIQGHLFKKDPLYNVERTLRDWVESKSLKKIKKIPRPPNAFMVFRAEQSKIFKGRQTELSGMISMMWRNEKNRDLYFQKAERLRVEHELKYPDYVYRPQKKEKKFIKNTPLPTKKKCNKNSLKSHSMMLTKNTVSFKQEVSTVECIFNQQYLPPTPEIECKILNNTIDTTPAQFGNFVDHLENIENLDFFQYLSSKNDVQEQTIAEVLDLGNLFDDCNNDLLLLSPFQPSQLEVVNYDDIKSILNF